MNEDCTHCHRPLAPSTALVGGARMRLCVSCLAMLAVAMQLHRQLQELHQLHQLADRRP